MRIHTALLAQALLAAILLPASCKAHAQTPSGTPVIAPLAATAPTAVPALVPYTGVAVGSDAKPLTTETAITFLIFKDEQGGEPLFTETQTVVPDATGHYKVQLGATLASGIPLGLFSSGEARWLEVQIAGQTPQPRTLLVSVPYALKAADAATLGGLPASAFALAGTPTVASATSPAITPDTATDVTTTGGTAGYLAEFSGANSIVDSPVFVNGANIGIGNPTPAATLDVNGGAVFRGEVQVTRNGNATAGAGTNSFPLLIKTQGFNSATNAAVNTYFQWEALATGNNTTAPASTLNLYYNNGTATNSTGFYFNPNGTVNFASGQTFPGTGTITGVTAGTALTGGGITGNVTLNLDTTKVPLLAAANTFTGNQTITGTETVTGSINSSASLFLPNTSSSTVGLVQLGPTPFLSNYGPAGSYNSFGGGAANFSLTGLHDVAFGSSALADATSGGYDVAYGASALLANSTGSENTAVGYQAGYFNTTGSSITALGYESGPSSATTNLINATAIGANAKVSQSNSLVLGQTTVGSPGATSVNVGIGTATPRSILEAVSNSPATLGPVLTLTNSGGSQYAAAAVDFNTHLPSTTGTYNPSARIVAQDDGNDGANLYFFSNIPGAANNSFGLNMWLTSNFQAYFGSLAPEPGNRLIVAAAYNETTGDGDGAVEGLGGEGYVTTADVGNGGPGGTFNGGYAHSTGQGGDGIDATAGTSQSGPNGLAGNFTGDINVTGSITAGVKDFKIDHPLDPANKYLVHSSVESSEMMNIYSGNVTTDELGLATVKLPDWFEAENSDFRYQLTVIGGRFAQAIVSKEIANNQFTISTNASNVKVSWQVTAVRQDAYAKANPLVVEQTKPADERGFYIHPELYGQPEEKQTEWGRHPQMMQHIKVQREQQVKAQQSSITQPNRDQPASAVNRQFINPASPAVTPATAVKP